jgi:hypothetical protein
LLLLYGSFFVVIGNEGDTLSFIEDAMKDCKRLLQKLDF